MTSVDFNFADPIASYDDSVESPSLEMSWANVGSIREGNFVVLENRPVKVVELVHFKPGKHGHAKASDRCWRAIRIKRVFTLLQIHLIGIDIFTGRRYEDVRPAGDNIPVPIVSKKDYTVHDVDNEQYMTLFDEVTCRTRSDLKLKQDLAKSYRQQLGKFADGGCQMKVTVLKALDEEQIIVLKAID